MIIISPVFDSSGFIPQKYTCDGGDINPELQIQNVPADAKSLALIMHDPDAPMPGGFTHWVVWNIDPRTSLIKEDSVPPGAIEGVQSAGRREYAGPCPPSGTHHYHFQLYALNTKLDLPADVPKGVLEQAIADHVIESAELVGLYKR